jgi:hypothetical protein
LMSLVGEIGRREMGEVHIAVECLPGLWRFSGKADFFLKFLVPFLFVNLQF